MKVSVATEERDDKLNIRDDLDILALSRELHRKLKESDDIYGKVLSKVERVGKNFSINGNLSIEVPGLRHIPEDIPKTSIPRIFRAGLAHEDAHAFLFPFMTRMNLSYAIAFDYLKDRKIPFDERLFNTVSNILSDVFNELVITAQRLAGYEHFPELRYLYVVRPQASEIEEMKRNRAQVEASPLGALFLQHNLAYTEMYEGRSSTPKPESPEWLSEHLYASIYKMASTFNIVEHVETIQTGAFTNAMRELIEYGLYDNADNLYNAIKTLVDSGKVKLQPQDYHHIKRLLSKKGISGINRRYWAYYSLLLAMYRLTLDELQQQKTACIALRLRNVDTGDNTPEPPPLDILASIAGALKGNAVLISPDLAEYVAKKLISATLQVRKPGLEAVSTVRKVTTRWYKYPRGRIDPNSVIEYSAPDWEEAILKMKVAARVKGQDYRKTYTLEANVPDAITIVVDESGSTSSLTSILAKIIGIDTTVYDVERTSIMAILYNVLRFSEHVPTTLVRFSGKVKVEKGTVKEIYNWLKTVDANNLMLGDTDIVRAVEQAVQMHRDRPANYFLLATDMQIQREQAWRVRELLDMHVKKSPTLILGVNADIPTALQDLDKRPHMAAVSVKTIDDYPKLEAAINKLAKLIYKT